MGAEATLLALDTATRLATVAVCRGARVLAEAEREVTTHSEGLLPLIDETLREAGLALAELDGVVCGRGPGSFTGLRIGMATAKGLCLAAARPLICVSSMLPLAAATVEALGRPEVRVAAVIDARRGEVFLRLYCGLEPQGREAALRPEALADHIPPEAGPVVLAGDGALAYRDVILAALGPRGELAPEGCHAIRARYLCSSAGARLAAGDVDDLAAAVPRYVRPSDARLPSKPFAGLGGGASVGLSAANPEEQLLEQLRETGLRLDREGRWWHEGAPVEHPRLAAALHRWLDRLEDGRFVLRLDDERVAYVEVEDAPYVVRTVELDGAGGEVVVHLKLSDGSEEELDYASLCVGEDNALYCEVKGRLEARFARSAYYLLGELIEAPDDEDGFVLRAAGRRWRIGDRPRDAGR